MGEGNRDHESDPRDSISLTQSSHLNDSSCGFTNCEQFEVFQSVVNPDKLTILERWTDQAALDAHAKLNATRPPLPPELRTGRGEREDYEYNRTR